MNKSELGKKIKARRSELGITQEDLAELSDTSSKTVREIERGQGNPRFNTIIAIVAVLGLVLVFASLFTNNDSKES